ncbi:MAG: hypothetical protein KJP12_05570 [Acidimicrobiia bacterium]|nr:hypothetical protein [Acidimicrobiia bacterium]MBT8214677.1 hypothetical protein [Acidimicrobiia bacterium]NNF68776.1 hypothetical protein [Acidimicrobiia bacterium]
MTPETQRLPLRDRLPDYLALFAVGVAVSATIGLVIWLVSSAHLADAVGYTMAGLGVVLLLSGGASGGGFANIGVGAVEAMFGGRRRHDDDAGDPNVRMGRATSVDPYERLRKGLRPGPNPMAFWRVIGGACYLALGIAISGLG